MLRAKIRTQSCNMTLDSSLLTLILNYFGNQITGISCQLQVCYFPAHHLAPGHVRFSRNMKSLIFTIPIERGQQLVNCTEKGKEVVFICPESHLAPSQDSVYKMNAHLPCAIYSTDIFNLFYITYLENSFLSFLFLSFKTF